MPLDEREEALWMLQRLFSGSGLCNLGIAIYPATRIDPGLLRESVQWVVCRHPLLRSLVQTRNGRPIRVFPIPEKIYVPINVRSSTRSSLESDMLALSGEAFDISRDELARFNLLELTDGTQVLLAVIHQLIFDTLSIPSFVQDLSKAYQSFASAGVPPSASPPSPIPGRSEPAQESLHYWSDRIAGIRPEGMLLAATDYISAGASMAGGRYGRLLSPAAQEAVRSLRRGTQRGFVVLVVDVSERNTLIINDFWLGLSADVDPGGARPLTAYGGASVTETNLAGTGIALGGAFAVADSQLALRARLSDPQFAQTNWIAETELLYNSARDFFGNGDVLVSNPTPAQDFAVLPYKRFGARLGFGHDLGVSSQIFFDYRLEKIDAQIPLAASDHRGLDVEPIDFMLIGGSSVLSTLRTTFVHDTRDEPVLPTRGHLLTASVDASPAAAACSVLARSNASRLRR